MNLLRRAAGAAWWPERPDERRRLVAVLAVALVVRVVWVLYAGREPTGYNTGDPLAYLYYGRELAAGHGYRSFVTGQPTAFYPIGYPLFIALFAWPVQHGLLPDDVTRLVGLAQAVLGTATVLCVWLIARRIASPRVALVAAALTAGWPGLVFMTASLNLETVFVAFLAGALAVLVGPGEGDRVVDRPARLLVAGVLLGLSALVRPFSLPVIGIVLVAALAARVGVVRALRATALVALPVVLILLPWVARNQRELGTLSLSTNMGETFCLDHHVGAIGSFSFPPDCFEGFDGVPVADIERVRNTEDTKRALRFIREHPGTEAKLILKRIRYSIDGDHDGLVSVESGTANPFLPDGLRTTLRLLGDWWYWITLTLAVPGAVLFARRRGAPFARWLVALTALVLIAIPLELYGYTRFHVPVLPFQAIAAAITLVALDDLRRRRSAPPP